MGCTEYFIYDDVYDMILNGIKKIEIRLLDDKWGKIKIGDKIKFKVLNDEKKNLFVRVNRLYVFDDIDMLWNNIDRDLIGCKDTKKEEFVELFYEIFNKEDINNHKIVGIGFKLIDKKDKHPFLR